MELESITSGVSQATGLVKQLNSSLNATLNGRGITSAAAGAGAEHNDLWPILAKGNVDKVRNKLNPLGDPTISKYYHDALEQGRMHEKSIAEAQHWLLQKKQSIMRTIEHKFDSILLATDGKLSDTPRRIKYAADAVRFLNDVNQYQQQVIALIQAVTTNIGILRTMEQNMTNAIQRNLNALASLLHEICNWGLPDLPALPNIFGGTIWHWNGFQFLTPNSFKPNIGFDTNFSFNQCVIHLPNWDIFRNYPSSITDGKLTYGSTPFVPPLGGILPDISKGQNIGSPDFVKWLKTTNTVSGGANFNPDTPPGLYIHTATQASDLMVGSVVNPKVVISNYQMPPEVYRENILSIVPQTLAQIKQSAVSGSAVESERATLMHYVTLEQVVASKFDANLTAAWLFYMDTARKGRAGTWLPHFQSVYADYIQPSVDYLSSTSIPWNNSKALREDGTLVDDPSNELVQASPVAIPFISTLASMDSTSQRNTLWKLSFLEAGLLGYIRTQEWDGYADVNFVSTFSGVDLDYRASAISADAVTVMLGEGTAEYPVPSTFPVSMSAVMQAVILMAATHIQNTPSFQSNRPQLRYTYNTYAEARTVDRFSQFWREFNLNLSSLLLQDPYLIQYVVSYTDLLDSAIDPLGDPSLYHNVQVDAASRNRSWEPGHPLLQVPLIPNLVDTTKSAYICVQVNTGETPTNQNYWRPMVHGDSGVEFTWRGTWDNQTGYAVNDAVYYTSNGWVPSVDYPGSQDLDTAAFLDRPDIRALPISAQIAMLRTNLSFAGMMRAKEALSSSVESQVNLANQLLTDFRSVGFRVDLLGTQTVPVGQMTTAAFELGPSDTFDLTNNVTNSTTFTIQSTGSYMIVAFLDWGPGEAGTRTITVMQNGQPIAAASTDPSSTGPIELPLASNGFFLKGDVVTLAVNHNLDTPQTITHGYFTMTRYTESQDSIVIPDAGIGTGGTGALSQKFTAAVDLAALTALAINPDGTVSPIDPITVQTDTVNNCTIYPYADGICLAAAQKGEIITPAITYGGVYTVPSAEFIVGGLLYVGAGGVLTQDFNSILSTVNWVICVGRAVSRHSFVYEPHIPTRTVLGF
jgi:hypothetical protein